MGKDSVAVPKKQAVSWSSFENHDKKKTQRCSFLFLFLMFTSAIRKESNPFPPPPLPPAKKWE